MSAFDSLKTGCSSRDGGSNAPIAAGKKYISGQIVQVAGIWQSRRCGIGLYFAAIPIARVQPSAPDDALHDVRGLECMLQALVGADDGAAQHESQQQRWYEIGGKQAELDPEIVAI